MGRRTPCIPLKPSGPPWRPSGRPAPTSRSRPSPAATTRNGGRSEPGRSTPSSTAIPGIRCPIRSPGRPSARIAPTAPRGSSSTSSTRPRRKAGCPRRQTETRGQGGRAAGATPSRSWRSASAATASCCPPRSRPRCRRRRAHQRPESFRGRVARSLDTLLEWAADDVDRTMLFAAQLEIVVPPGSTPEAPRAREERAVGASCSERRVEQAYCSSGIRQVRGGGVSRRTSRCSEARKPKTAPASYRRLRLETAPTIRIDAATQRKLDRLARRGAPRGRRPGAPGTAAKRAAPAPTTCDGSGRRAGGRSRRPRVEWAQGR